MEKTQGRRQLRQPDWTAVAVTFQKILPGRRHGIRSSGFSRGCQRCKLITSGEVILFFGGTQLKSYLCHSFNVPKTVAALTMLLMISSQSEASLPNSASRGPASPVDSRKNTDNPVLSADVLTLKRDLRFIPRGITTNQGTFANVKNRQVELAAGDSITIIDREIGPSGTSLFRLGIESESADMTDVWVAESDLDPADFDVTVTSIDRRLNQLQSLNLSESEVAAMSESDEDIETEETLVASISRQGVRVKRRSKGTCRSNPYQLGCCYAYVKRRLLALKKVSVYLEGVSASSAGRTLRKYGFKTLPCSTRTKTPPNGLVCTFTGGPHGHVEIFEKGCWMYGVGCKTAWSKPSRVCTSCEIK